MKEQEKTSPLGGWGKLVVIPGLLVTPGLDCPVSTPLGMPGFL